MTPSNECQAKGVCKLESHGGNARAVLIDLPMKKGPLRVFRTLRQCKPKKRTNNVLAPAMSERSCDRRR